MGSYSKVGHIGEEGIDLDHLLNTRTSLLQYGLQVGDAGSRLLLDGALDEIALGIAGDLSRTVDGSRCLDGLGLWSWSCQAMSSNAALLETVQGTYVGASGWSPSPEVSILGPALQLRGSRGKEP